MPHDLVLKGATVVDLSQDIYGVRDGAINGDTIAAIEAGAAPCRSSVFRLWRIWILLRRICHIESRLHS